MPLLYAALITPFSSPTGAIDLEPIPAHLRWLEANGVDGVVPGGTTGEGPLLSLAERKALIEKVLEHRGNLRVIAGTGCANLPETIEASRFAIEAGAEAVMVIPPFYFKNLSNAGLLAYYRAVADSLPAGGKLMLYHIPPISQIPVQPPVIDGLYQSHPEVIWGYKDSGGDDDYTAMLCGHYPKLQIFNGSANLISNCLADGAVGSILAIGNCFPRELRELYDAFDRNDGSLAAAQAKVTALSNLVKPAQIPAIKALMPYLAELPASSVRVPNVNLADAQIQTLWEKVQAVLG